MKECGIDRIISKPFVFEEITQVISEAIERRGK
jgi:hypothetical protein